MTATETTERRTYGGWCHPRSYGFPGFGAIGSLAIVGAVAFGILVALSGGLLGLAVWILLTAPAIALFRIRRGHRDGWQIVGSYAAHYWRQHWQTHEFVRGHIGKIAHGDLGLPGLLADSELLSAHLNGLNFGIVHLKRSRHYTVLLTGDLGGSALVDTETHDTWVACFGRWLAHLGRERALLAAAVTISTAGDPGYRLGAETRRLCPDGSVDLVKNLYADIRELYPRGAPSTTAHVALTYTSRRSRRGERRLSLQPTEKHRGKDESSMGAQLAARIPAHTRDLNTAGLSNVRAMTAAEISEYVRAAFHPGAAAEIDEKRANGESAGVAWEDAGPVAAYPGWDYYRHDDGISVTCEMVEPPQGVVESTILEPVLKPSTLIPRKRVTFIYRTHDPAEAPRIADRDRRAAFGRATQRGGEGKAHEEAQLEVARKTARDQQHGAGLTRVAVLATATVTNVEDFSTAGDTLMQLAQESQLLVRPCYRVQDSAFTAALGVGVVLSEHTTLGGAWEEWK